MDVILTTDLGIKKKHLGSFREFFCKNGMIMGGILYIIQILATWFSRVFLLFWLVASISYDNIPTWLH